MNTTAYVCGKIREKHLYNSLINTWEMRTILAIRHIKTHYTKACLFKYIENFSSKN